MARKSKNRKKDDVDLSKVTIAGIYPYQFVLVICMAIGIAASFGIGVAVLTAPDPDEELVAPPDEAAEEAPSNVDGVPVRRGLK